MSMISNDMVEQYANRKGIVLRGDKVESEHWHQLLVDKQPLPQNFQDRLDHLEELRIQMWHEKGFQLVDGKWRRIVKMHTDKKYVLDEGGYLPNGIHVHKLNVDEPKPWIASIRIGPWYYCQGGSDEEEAIDALFVYMKEHQIDFEKQLAMQVERLKTLNEFLATEAK
jgi:hypothetical protein